MYNFDEIIERENTDSIKYDLRQLFFNKKDVIPMWVADMDFETPGFIQEAVKARTEHPIYGYSIKPNSYYQSIIKWLKDEHQWDVKKDEISFSPGVVPGVALAVMAYTKPGDKIVIQQPVYFPFFSTVLDNGRQLLENDLIEKDNYYTIDFEDLEKKLSDSKAKVLLTSNPHNPVGRVWTEDELNKMLELCKKHDVLLLSDEIHSDLIFKGHKHIPAAKLSDDAKNRCITFMAPSKTFNMAGLSTSFLVIQNPELKKEFDNVVDAYHLGFGNVFGNVALEAAYTKGKPWLESLISYLQVNINLVDEFLKKEIPEITFTPPESTYLLWLNCKSLNMDDESLNEFFINQASLGLSKGIIFGQGGSGFMRMNVACPTSLVEKALNQLKTAIDEQKNKG